MAKETMRVEICEDDDPESKLKAMWIKGDHLRVSVIVDHCGGKQLNKVVEVLNRLFKPLWWLSLELYYNDFIPDSVWDLANVDELCINHNLRAMPPEIIKLTKLRKLGIEFNPFKKFPVVVCRLEQLEELSCYNCHLSDIPSSFASLRNLLELHLGVNDFEQFPEVICELRNLRRLWIYANKLSSLPRSFANLQELRELGASENRFKDFPSVVCELPNLEHLFLDGNQLSELPLAITKLVRLKYLNLSRNSFTSFPLFLGDLPRLSEFYSSGWSNLLVSISLSHSWYRQSPPRSPAWPRKCQFSPLPPTASCHPSTICHHWRWLFL